MKRSPRRRSGRPPLAPLLTATLLLGALPGALPGASLRAQPVRPEPPPPRKVLYDPDQGTCSPTHLESRFHEQLKPWADQPEPVLARLRQLQAEMLRASLKRCVGRGLLSPAEASGVEQRLGLAGAGPADTQPSGQRP